MMMMMTIAVKTGSSQSCSVYGGQPVAPDRGYLSSLTSIESGGQFGTAACPWLSGTVSDASVREDIDVNDDYCARHHDGWTVVVHEYNTTVEFPECRPPGGGGTNENFPMTSLSRRVRERLIYSSRAHNVQLYFRHAYIDDLLPLNGHMVIAPPTHVLVSYEGLVVFFTTSMIG